MDNRNKQILPLFLQLINTAISEDVMTVNSLESSIAEVKFQGDWFFDLIILSAFRGSSCLIILTGYRCLTDGTRKTAKEWLIPQII